MDAYTFMAVKYPNFICKECSDKSGHPTQDFFQWWNPGECGWCLKSTLVAPPRDFGYPPYDGREPIVQPPEKQKPDFVR